MLLVTSLSCSLKDTNLNECRIVIAGQIYDFDGESGNITFMFSNIVDPRRIFEQVRCNVDKDGRFKIDTIFGFPQEFLSPYGFLYCSPGDSIFLEIKNSRIQKISGTGAKINTELSDFNNNFLKRYPDSTKHLSPTRYKSYISHRERVYRDSLAAFINSSAPSQKCIEWANDIIRYESWCNLLRYPWLHCQYNHLSVDSLNLPDDYYSFLDDYDMNNFTLISRNHILFLHEFFRYCLKNSADSLKKINELVKKGDTISAIKMNLRMITNKTSGLTEELMLTKYFHIFLRARDIQDYKLYFDSSSVSNEYFLWELNQELERSRKFLANQQTINANLTKLNDTDNSEVLNSIISKYQGNIIYMDFWAPWCGPCLSEMPYSKKHQEFFKDEKITFLFLGNQCKEDAWKAAIANYNLTGEHILLNQEQFAQLSKKFDINGIPHYVIIDRKGRVVSKDANRPSNEIELREQLQKLLIENKP